MKRRIYGPSLYYASDKNIFDALTQHRVDAETVRALFAARNTIVSKATAREDLALYFGSLTHDYYDHQAIAARLGVIPKRERLTSIELTAEVKVDEVLGAVEAIKSELEAGGDVVHIKRDGDNVSVRVQYSVVDYSKSEFRQVQQRDGLIEFVKEGTGYLVRSNQNDVLSSIRASIVKEVRSKTGREVPEAEISLLDLPAPRDRSEFFYNLMTKLPGLVRGDVTDVYVYKAPPTLPVEEEDSDERDEEPDFGSHIERVLLRGKGVTQSELLQNLCGQQDYFIVRAAWIVQESRGEGKGYEVEVQFEEPSSCTRFSYLLKGVFVLEDGKLSNRRRQPTKPEVDFIAQAIESTARKVVAELKARQAASGAK